MRGVNERKHIRTSGLIAGGLLLVAPAGAAAAPFGELPFRAVSGPATCLRATGVPGELVRLARGTTVEVSQAGGPVTGSVDATGIDGCPRVATRPGGAGVIAFTDDGAVRASVRDPGGAAWPAPTEAVTRSSAVVAEAEPSD